MATQLQQAGDRGEILIMRKVACPRCKLGGKLKRLPTGFKCADVICDFCGYLAQVKSVQQATLPNEIRGAAWQPVKDRIDAGIYFPLFVVLTEKGSRRASVWYLPADLQTPDMYVERPALAADKRRAGWKGVTYDLRSVKDRFVQLV